MQASGRAGRWLRDDLTLRMLTQDTHEPLEETAVPKFQKLDPTTVVLGRGRAAVARRQPYREAIRAGKAGRIELDQADVPGHVKRDLRLAAQEEGVRVRSSWEDATERVLLWKRTGS